MRFIARSARKPQVPGVDVHALCTNPCKMILEPLEIAWSIDPREKTTRRYRSMLLVEPWFGVEIFSETRCNENTCFKLEGKLFWRRGVDTLASHIVACEARLVFAPDGPWLEEYRKLLNGIAEVTSIECETAYCADPLHNPFFHEGGSTIVYESIEQLGSFDAIIVPGYPSLIRSIEIGLSRLLRAGVVDELPRIYVVDIGVPIPRWLVDEIDAVEVRVTSRRYIEQAENYAVQNGLPLTKQSLSVIAARDKLLSLGEVSREEKVLAILL